MGEWWRRTMGLLRRTSVDAELEEEMRMHLEMKASDGVEPAAARRGFGNVALLLEDSRAAWGWPGLEDWLRDFRYALRGLARGPAFAATVILTLALGIGSSSIIFSLIDAVLVRPLPYPDSGRLVAIWEAKSSDRRSRTPVAPGRLEDWQRMNGAFDGIAASNLDMLIETSGAAPERLYGAFVSPRFFAVLAAPLQLGRAPVPVEEEFGGPAAIVISDGLWRRRFGSDPAVLGSSLILGGRPFPIVGVMPPAFQYPRPTVDVWIPRQAPPGLMAIREARFYMAVGRLKPGATIDYARADLDSVQRRLGGVYPKTDAGWGVSLTPLKEELVGPVRNVLWLLFGSVSLLLLVACANVACLLLARLNSRGAEIATRYSLGAGRAALARQLFAEGLVYALMGGVSGAIAAVAGIDILRKQAPNLPRITELAIDIRAVALIAAISLLAAVVFSLAPILVTWRRNAGAVMIRGGRGIAGGRQRLPRILVSMQLALATALLIGAGLFVRSLLRLEETPLGFRPERVLALRVTASFNEPPDAAAQRHRRTIDALSSLPGVTAVAMASGLPGVNSTWPREFEIAGEPTVDGSLRFAAWRVVTDRYFQTVGIPIVEGRACRMSADAIRPFEVLVNRSFVARHFAGRDPIGRTVRGGVVGDSNQMIVGVVADAREDGPGMEPQPVGYVCGYLRYWPDSEFLVETSNPRGIAGAVREAARRVDPARPVYSVRPLEEALDGALSQTRFRTLLVSLFSVMALALASVGLYGVMAYMVSQRIREIGVRLALGAGPGRIAADVLRSGGILAGAGAAAGIALAAGVSRVLGTLLYGVGASDPVTYLSATCVLMMVALIACLIPTRRATSIDPIRALREQ